MQCTAKSKRSGVQCGNDAIKGKDKCRMHGGKTPIKTGLYSKYAPQGLADMMEEARKDPRLTDVREILLVQSSLLNNFLKRYQMPEGEGLALNQEAIQLLMNISDTIGKNIERLNKIEEGEKFTIRIETVQRTIIQVVSIIKHFIPDARTQGKVADALSKVAV
jgi:hypothetical protein